MVMLRTANPPTPVRFRPQPRPGGEIGRRKGLKIPRRVTSVPVRLRPRAPSLVDSEAHVRTIPSMEFLDEWQPKWVCSLDGLAGIYWYHTRRDDFERSERGNERFSG